MSWIRCRLHGFDAMSMSDVAAAAGMSRRTLYRYFATKDDIVFDAPRQWLDVVHQVPVLRSYSVVAASPELASRHGRFDAEWVQHYLELLGPEVATLEDGVLQGVTGWRCACAAGRQRPRRGSAGRARPGCC